MFIAEWLRRSICVSVCIAVQILNATPSGSRSVIEEDGDKIKISVYIDRKQEPKVRELEGSAMLRTNRQLRKRFKGLPKTFSIPVSVERAELDLDSNVYVYVTNIRRKDVEDFIANFKEQEAERLEKDRLKTRTEDAEECRNSVSSTNELSAANESIAETRRTSTNGCRQTKADVSQTNSMICAMGNVCCVSNHVSFQKCESNSREGPYGLMTESKMGDPQEIFSNVASNRIDETEILQEIGRRQNEGKDDRSERIDEKAAEEAISNLF